MKGASHIKLTAGGGVASPHSPLDASTFTKEELRAAGVPLVPGSDGSAALDEIRETASRIGFPVMLKATAGGGGKGMRRVAEEAGLADAYAAATAEAEAAFGDGSLYLEKVVMPARHVEIQVLCDAHGDVLTLGERECSIQRRHQKLIEESPSPAISPETREEMEASVPVILAIIRSTGPPGANCTMAKVTSITPKMVGMMSRRRFSR